MDAHAFVCGSRGAAILDSLSPGSADIIIEGKRGLDTLTNTNLDFILRSRGIKTLVVAGFLTNCCVESTARTGYEKGSSVVALSDCAATLSEEEQYFTFAKNLPMQGHSIKTFTLVNMCIGFDRILCGAMSLGQSN